MRRDARCSLLSHRSAMYKVVGCLVLVVAIGSWVFHWRRRPELPPPAADSVACAFAKCITFYLFVEQFWFVYPCGRLHCCLCAAAFPTARFDADTAPLPPGQPPVQQIPSREYPCLYPHPRKTGGRALRALIQRSHRPEFGLFSACRAYE